MTFALHNIIVDSMNPAEQYTAKIRWHAYVYERGFEQSATDPVECLSKINA